MSSVGRFRVCTVQFRTIPARLTSLAMARGTGMGRDPTLKFYTMRANRTDHWEHSYSEADLHFILHGPLLDDPPMIWTNLRGLDGLN